ncbi:MAG TPA: YbaK/EbsC family protein, partial [Polyangia bacterium]|nr:YbaK/EbsC family protein [Polyangia bacterium]
MRASAPTDDRHGEGRARKHLVWLLVSLAYLVVAPYFPRINNPNENVRIWMTRAIVEEHTLALDGTCAAWGYVDDKATDHGRLYSSKAPGTSLLGVPVLWTQTKLWHALGWPSPSKRAATFGLRFFSVVPCVIAFLFFFARWIERRARSTTARDLLLVAVGLGTLIYPYGILFVGHAQAALAAFAAFMALTWAVDDAAPTRRQLVLAGAMAGAAVLFEYQLLLVAIVLAGLALWRMRARAGWFALGAAPLAVALGAYHTALFGRPWAFPYGHLENQTYAHAHHGSGFFGLGAPQPAALASSLFSISYGLFVFSPFLLFGLLAALRRLRSPARAHAVVILLSCALLLLFLAGMTHWRARAVLLAVLVRGDRAVNEIKLQKALGAAELAMASEAGVRDATGAPVGFAGPVGLKAGVPVYCDVEVRALA